MYAVSFLEGTAGTMWAVAIFRVLHPKRECYLFCQEKERWFRAVGKGLEWEEVVGSRVTTPKGVWAGIGVRELSERGRMAIGRVMGCGVVGEG